MCIKFLSNDRFMQGGDLLIKLPGLATYNRTMFVFALRLIPRYIYSVIAL
jgi:hypothetical protein